MIDSYIQLSTGNDSSVSLLYIGEAVNRSLSVTEWSNSRSKQMFKDFNGNVWSDAEVKAYNQYTWEISRTMNPDVREFLMNQRHRFFVMVVNGHLKDKTSDAFLRNDW